MILDFDKAYEHLLNIEKNILKKYSKLFTTLTNVLHEYDNVKHIIIRHNRFILKQEFLILFSQNPLLTELKIASDTIYEFIQYLKNKKYIHESSDYYPVKKQLAQLNKNFSFLSPSAFSLIDEIEDFQKHIYTNLAKKDLELACFISLVYFEEKRWDEGTLNKALSENYFLINDIGCQCIIAEELDDGFKNIDIYRVKLTSKLLMQFYKSSAKKVFQEYKFLKEAAEKEIQSYFKKGISSGNIQKALMMNEVMNERFALVALKYKKVLSVPLSLSELSYLHKDIVPQHLLDIEQINLDLIQKSVPDKLSEFDDYNDEMYIDTAFDFDDKVSPLFLFVNDRKKNNLLNATPKDIKQEHIDRVKDNFFSAFKVEQDISTSMVYEYIYYMLDRIYVGSKKSDQIKITTFIDYIGILKRHFFSVFTDFEHVDDAKLFFILKTTKQKGLVENSLEKLQYLIRDFFNFHKIKTKKHDINAKYMLKSLVFKQEIDSILKSIEEYFRFEANKRDKKYFKFYKFLTLQFQAYIIFGFYTGLRLNELRTRTHADIIEEPLYIYDSRITKNVFSVNVNKKGLKGIKKINSFKSSNATRRVCFEVGNEMHAEIFKDFIQKSMSYGSRYLFKDFEYKNSKVSKKVIELPKLSFLNQLIQQVTHRYTSLHSLRHSYATYWFLDSINRDENFNDIIMNFSIEIGHVTPQVTFQNYIHYELIEELNYGNKL